jgi:hypothetical protein
MWTVRFNYAVDVTAGLSSGKAKAGLEHRKTLTTPTPLLLKPPNGANSPVPAVYRLTAYRSGMTAQAVRTV